MLVVVALLLLGGAATLATPDDKQPAVAVAQFDAAPDDIEATATPAPRPAEADAPVLVTSEPTHEPTATPSPSAAIIAPTPTAIAPPLPDAGRAQLARFAPVALVIPRIGVEAWIVPVGVTPDRQLQAPADYGAVGWYHAGPLPGEPGRAVLDGHLDSRTGPAVFYRLDELVPGDEIIVRMGAGRDDRRFVVTESSVYWTDEAPLDRVFGASDQPELVLITCDGPFDGGGGGYLQRRIVFAVPANSPAT